MSFSSMPPVPPPPPTAEEEQAHREREREAYNKASSEFRRWYNDKMNIEADRWDLVRALGDARDLMEDERRALEDEDNTPRISSGSDANPYPPQPGFYWYNHSDDKTKKDHKDGERILYKGGSVRPVPGNPLTETGVSAGMDFIAGKLGSDTIVLEIAGYATSIYPDLQKQARKELELMMDVAEKKGLAFEFGPATLDYLATLSDDKFKAFRAREAASQYNREINKMKMDVSDEKALRNIARKIENQHVNLPGSNEIPAGETESDKVKNLKAKAYADIHKAGEPHPDIDTADGNEKYFKAIEDHVESAHLEKRIEEVESALNRLTSAADAQQSFIEHPEKIMNAKEAADPSLENQKAALERIERLVDPSNPNNSKAKRERDKLMLALNKEHEALKVEIAVWKKELEKLSGGAPGSITEAHREKVQAKIDKMEGLEKKLDDQIKQREKIKAWDGGGRQALLKDKKDKIDEEVKARQLRNG